MPNLSTAPLTNSSVDTLSFGIRISGITRADIADPAICQELNHLFETHGMIVFENVEASNDMQVLLSEVFGPLKEHPVKAVTRVDAEGLPGVVEINSPAHSGGLVEFAGKQLSHWLPWHFDHAYNNELNRAGVLRATVIVPSGGITGFADGIAIYNACPPDILAEIAGKDVIYTLNIQYDTMRFGKPDGLQVHRRKPAPAGFEEQARAMPRASIPLSGPVHPVKKSSISHLGCPKVSSAKKTKLAGKNSKKSAKLSTISPTKTAIITHGNQPIW